MTRACGFLAAVVLVAAAGAAHGQGAPIRAPELMPGREARLRVVKARLVVGCERAAQPGPPLARVGLTAVVENPTGEVIEEELGFPILHPVAVRAVQVQVEGVDARAGAVSSHELLGRAREIDRAIIDRGIAADPTLARLTAALRAATGSRPPATRAASGPRALARRAAAEPRALATRAALADHLARKGWPDRDAALMAEVAGLLPAAAKPGPATAAGLGPLAALGERRATQLLATLAARFDPARAASPERVVAAWAAEAREQALDLGTGQVRLRAPAAPASAPAEAARLERDRSLKPAQKESLRRILRSLPPAAPLARLSLVRYALKVPAHSRRTVRLSYTQRAYPDAGPPVTWQVGVVVQPASLWQSHGPIGFEVRAPAGVAVRASAPCTTTAAGACRGTVAAGAGPLLVAVDAAAWERAAPGR
jgi:hypothetical protein